MGSETSDMGISWNVIGKLFMALQLSNIGFQSDFTTNLWRSTLWCHLTWLGNLVKHMKNVFMVNIYSIYYSYMDYDNFTLWKSNSLLQHSPAFPVSWVSTRSIHSRIASSWSIRYPRAQRMIIMFPLRLTFLVYPIVGPSIDLDPLSTWHNTSINSPLEGNKSW